MKDINKERIKMAIPFYGFYRALYNAARGSDGPAGRDELTLWAAYQASVDLGILLMGAKGLDSFMN